MFVVDNAPIPLAEPDDPGPPPVPCAVPTYQKTRTSSRTTPSRSGEWIAQALIVALCSLHGLAIWCGLGGRAGLNNGWPLWRDDHPLYYHSALVTRSFLKSSWTTAGYDPSFMAGYAKSVVFPASSTLPELVVATFGGDRPELAYKLYVLVSAAAVPWLIAFACSLWRIPIRGIAIAVLLDLLYIWTDFPINYVFWGMVPYFLAIPVAMAATAAFGRFLADRGALGWLMSASLMSAAFLIHFTTAMIVIPAAALAYLAETARTSKRVATRSPRTRGPGPTADVARLQRDMSLWFHISIWIIPIFVLAVNAFWWLPGIWLASTKGESGFTFNHPEGVVSRLLEIVNSAGVESPVQTILLAAGLPGLFLLFRRSPTEGLALAAFCAAGLFWGYLAGAWRALDFLQPGRHTYACYTALAVAGGAGLDELLRRLRAGSREPDHLDRWVMAGLLLIGIRMLGYPLAQSIKGRLACDIEVRRADWGGLPLIDSVRLRSGPGEPFLSSRPSPRLLWVIDRVRQHVGPGERLLYEEGGKSLAGVPDPFQGGRFSGILPKLTDVELIGGPYLHAALKSNFTQFGEGMLFGRVDWDRSFFEKYAKLYRPAAILCWSPHARRFCQENRDLIKVVEDDGTVLIGRVAGFAGDFIEGDGRVEASAGRIRIHDLSPGLDGSALLRYHSVPYLKSSPSVAIEREYREDDPVPFIRLRPTAGTRSVELEMQLPVGR
jgi:hypothetical protein